VKRRLHWLALHGFVRAMAAMGARGGDLQARLIADPTVAANPVPFYDELRGQGPLIKGRVNYLAVDHALAHELLRSDDFRVLMYGGNLPAPLRWLETRLRDDLLHPLRAPSLLAVEPPDHTRYRKTVSAVFTSRAVAGLRDGVEQTAATLLDELAGQSGVSDVVDIVGRYCSQLPVAIISDTLTTELGFAPTVHGDILLQKRHRHFHPRAGRALPSPASTIVRRGPQVRVA